MIPILPIERFEPVFDETHMPKPIDVPQDIEPWAEALRMLLTDRQTYETEADKSREAAIGFVSKLRAADFEDYLSRLEPAPELPQPEKTSNLSPSQRALLLKRLRDPKTK